MAINAWRLLSLYVVSQPVLLIQQLCSVYVKFVICGADTSCCSLPAPAWRTSSRSCTDHIWRSVRSSLTSQATLPFRLMIPYSRFDPATHVCGQASKSIV
ncbi:hypothetical protein BKA56DRAFT_599319 [Ilyonectria sp. MPI-CAGE-AT-0026]|nr:hypothetical protein BKA56DRAFT_599319 [Ilyonectria sp. MPI-CAGE-AT-0026]